MLIRIPDNRLVDLRLVVPVGILSACPVSPRAEWPPNNSLQLTRLAGGKLELPCPPEYARMDNPLPEPPGS
jgi:hypothetical protein